jgi:hypothetical protein
MDLGDCFGRSSLAMTDINFMRASRQYTKAHEKNTQCNSVKPLGNSVKPNLNFVTRGTRAPAETLAILNFSQ